MRIFYKTLIIMGLYSIFGCSNSDEKNADDETIRVEQKEGFTEITTGKSEVELDLSVDSLLFLPVIRNFSEKDVFTETVINQPLGDNIGVFIARVGTQKNRNTGIDYVLKDHLDTYKLSEAEIFQIALTNIKNARLKIDGLNDKETNDMMISISSEIGLSTCILYDQNFIEKLLNDLGTKELSIAIINSGTLYITTPNSSFEKRFESMADEVEYTDVLNVNPALYKWKNGNFTLLKKYKE